MAFRKRAGFLALVVLCVYFQSLWTRRVSFESRCRRAEGMDWSFRDSAEEISGQKLIDDGGKWKNFFKVVWRVTAVKNISAQVGDETKMLPEVMSKLDFEPKDHARPGDLRAEVALHKRSYWGRFYVDGWPQPIQYLRAHFGEATPSAHRMPIHLSEPWDACGYQRYAAEMRLDAPVIVLAKRGACTFGQKANATKDSLGGDNRSAASILVLINNEPGIIHAPGPDAHDVRISVAMIAEDDGEQLAAALRRRPNGVVNGTFVPVNCIDHSETRAASNSLCEVVTSRDRDYVASSLIDGGTLHLGGTDFEYLLANFGTAVPANGRPPDQPSLEMALVLANPPDGCEPLAPLRDASTALLVRRGHCDFLTKAANAQAMGAIALVLSNLDPADSLVRASCHPRWAATNISIPVVLTSTKVADVAIYGKALPAALTPRGRGHEAAWDKLKHYGAHSAWLIQSDKRDALYAKLKTELDFLEWPERESWLSSTISVVNHVRTEL